MHSGNYDQINIEIRVKLRFLINKYQRHISPLCMLFPYSLITFLSILIFKICMLEILSCTPQFISLFSAFLLDLSIYYLKLLYRHLQYLACLKVLMGLQNIVSFLFLLYSIFLKTFVYTFHIKHTCKSL